MILIFFVLSDKIEQDELNHYDKINQKFKCLNEEYYWKYDQNVKNLFNLIILIFS